jgi:hypothetical protein
MGKSNEPAGALTAEANTCKVGKQINGLSKAKQIPFAVAKPMRKPV